jgi:mRNA export factor
VLGSIEGRVAVQYFQPAPAGQKEKNFAFKCHREGTDVFAINDIRFHKRCGTFATAGGDGCYFYWDKDERIRIFNPNPNAADASKPNNRIVSEAITCSAFNHDGTIYAYGCSYDWSKGHQYANNNNGIFLHSVHESQIQKRGKKK